MNSSSQQKLLSVTSSTMFGGHAEGAARATDVGYVLYLMFF